MKILQIANNDFFSTYGGGQVYVKNLVDEMINQDMDIVVFSKNNKIEKHQIIERKYKNIFLYEYSTLDLVLLKDKIRQLAPDILHIHADKAFFSEICNELSIPCVITAHHGGITCPAGTLLNCKDEICRVAASQKNCLPCVLKGIKTGYLFYPVLKKLPVSLRLSIGRFLKKMPFMYFVTPIGMSSLFIEYKQKDWISICRNVDLMIAPSYAIAENMALNGLNAGKIEIVPHGIPVNSTKNNIFDPSVHNRGLKFFYLGRIAHIKGIHILLKAFTGLNSSECELHLIGDNQGKYERGLMKKYARHKNIFFHGKISPEIVNSKIREYDVLVHPAIYVEVFGLNISEALAEGKPVIATRCGGAEMQIQEGKNGLLVSPDNEKELLDAMNWVISHPEDVRRMSEEAPTGVISMQKHVETIGENYNKVLKKK